MGRKYRPGSGIGAAIAFFGMTVYLVYKLSFDTVHNLFGENVEEILLLISVIGGVIIGKQIYRLMVRNLGEDRAANLDFKIYKTTITTVILVALFILLKNHRRL
jgi:ABC-type enterochelin transport system permease subunit